VPNHPLKLHECPSGHQEDAAAPTPAAGAVPPLLVPADVAGPMCGRSEASWWRDHGAKRIPAPVKLGGRTLWRVEELHAWVTAGCPSRSVWEALEKACRK
jgi:predicted DNA-binding transcriptional regulator AlpA